MAGKTIKDRCDQQTSGFHTSNKGKFSASHLKKRLLNGEIINLYYRNSRKIQVLGVKDVSLCSVEEKVLINRFKKRYDLLNGKRYNQKEISPIS
jgi:hypothetical protein